MLLTPSFFYFRVNTRLLREVYYLLYDNYEIPSKVAFNPEQPSLGRIRADSVTPPHNNVTIKICISRVEKTPAIAYADLFADISCNTPLRKDHTGISSLRSDCPGLSPKEPMAIVLNPIPLVGGRYVIKNRAADVYWEAWSTSRFSSMVHFLYYQSTGMDFATKKIKYKVQVNEHSPIIQVFRG